MAVTDNTRIFLNSWFLDINDIDSGVDDIDSSVDIIGIYCFDNNVIGISTHNNLLMILFDVSLLMFIIIEFYKIWSDRVVSGDCELFFFILKTATVSIIKIFFWTFNRLSF